MTVRFIVASSQPNSDTVVVVPPPKWIDHGCPKLPILCGP